MFVPSQYPTHRQLLNSILLGNSKIKLLSKIENQRGMDNYEAILTMSDGIVIDRGYLGAEVDVEVVTTAQKKMIAHVRCLFLSSKVWQI